MDNRNKRKQHNEPMRNLNKYMCTRATKSWLVLVLHLIGWEGGASYFKPITERSKAKLKNFGLLSTRIWKGYWDITLLIMRENKLESQWLLNNGSLAKWKGVAMTFLGERAQTSTSRINSHGNRNKNKS